MTYAQWKNEVRRRLQIAGEDADLLMAKAEDGLSAMYVGGDPAITAARKLHRWRLQNNPMNLDTGSMVVGAAGLLVALTLFAAIREAFR